jgi:hypothetical protein
MAKSTPLTCLRSSLTSVLLPEPEGAEMMNRIPATFLSFLFELPAFSFQLLALSSVTLDHRFTWRKADS